MGQVLHGSATTTEAVRRAIQHSQESLRRLAKHYRINQKTVAKWKERASVADLPTGPKEARSTVLSIEDEAIIVAFRKHTLLPLDDCLYALQATIPHLTRSSLHRCLQRHGISRLLDVEGDKLDKRKFKTYPILHKEFEFDLVLEPDQQLTLIECKMKTLTRRARGTATVEALSDLARSFVVALIQMVRHEIALRVEPALALKGGGALSLAGRHVERVALTMLDHGSLQNRLFIRNIVRAILRHQLNSDDPERAKALRAINKALRELHELLAQLAKLEGKEFGDFLSRYEFGTWWLSIDQLGLIASGASTLAEGLRPMRHVTFQTGDLINELANAHRMRAAAEQA